MNTLKLENYRLIAFDLRRLKQLHVNLKAIQKIQFVGQLKNVDGVNADGAQSMFALTIPEKTKKKHD